MRGRTLEHPTEGQKNIFQSLPKIFGFFPFLSGVGSEGRNQEFGKLPTSKNATHFYGKGTTFLCLLRNFLPLLYAKGRERKRETTDSGFQPRRGNPLNETVTYKIDGTIYEVETSCGGSELLYDKMKRLIKSETVETPTDNGTEIRYNEDNNLFVGRSLQEE